MDWLTEQLFHVKISVFVINKLFLSAFKIYNFVRLKNVQCLLQEIYESSIVAYLSPNVDDILSENLLKNGVNLKTLHFLPSSDPAAVLCQPQEYDQRHDAGPLRGLHFATSLKSCLSRGLKKELHRFGELG